MPDIFTLENGYKFCTFVYRQRRMLRNLFCRCGGDEMIIDLQETNNIHNVLTMCNLNRVSPEKLRELLDYIYKLPLRTITRNDVEELSAILTINSPSLLWSIAFQCLANQPLSILDLNAVYDIWSCRAYGSVRYRWLLLWSKAMNAQGIQITSEQWAPIFSSLVDTTNWGDFDAVHATDFIALPFGTETTSIRVHHRVHDNYVIHVSIEHVLPCLSTISQFSPIHIWKCVNCMLQMCKAVDISSEVHEKDRVLFTRDRMLSICDAFANKEPFLDSTDDALIFECAVNALFILTCGSEIPRSTTNENTTLFIQQSYKNSNQKWGIYNGRLLRFTAV